ncbi:MAG: protease [Aldersonia sp.]|nr:protease [Aldersonia sp.]
MRSPIVRRALLLAAAALLPLGSAAVAGAAPDSNVSDQAAHLPVELARAVEHDLKLTPEQYLQRSELAQQLGEFAAIAAQQYPDAFAGNWLDENGRAIIGLAPSPSTAAARVAVEARGFEVREVAKSSATLEQEMVSFGDWLAGQPADIAAVVRGFAVDAVHNSIAVRLTALPGGLRLPAFIDPARVFVAPAPAAPQPAPAPVPTAAQDIAAALPPGSLGGGDAYAAVVGETAFRCSLGFNGVDGSGRVVNITAGHCNPDLRAAGTSRAPSIYELRPFDIVGSRLGTFARSNLEGHDFSIVAIEPNQRPRFENNGVRVPGAAPLAIDGVAQPVIGAPVCKSGSRTGFSCGTVSSVDQTVTVGEHRLTNGFSANLCALPGDSGGTVVTGTKALGVSSASSVADYSICEIPNILGAVLGDEPQLLATPISVILADNPGLRVRTN